MNTDFEYAVVGGGGMGSAAAYYLAREGKSTVVFEQFEIGHIRGASHGESRIIRYSYEWRDYVKLAKETYKLWDEVEREFGKTLFHKTGGLDLGYPGNGDFDLCIECLTAENVEHEVLNHTEIMERYPQFKVESEVRGLYQKDAGYLKPDDCVPAFAKLAQNHSASIVENTVIDDIKLSEESIEIASADKKWRVKKLILTAGPWAQGLVERLGARLPIEVTLEQYAFFRPRHPDIFSEKQFPVFIVYVGDGPINLYGFPFYEGLGVKVAEHRAGAITDAATRSFSPDADKLKRLTERAQKIFPDLTDEVTKVATCLYSNTPDRHFVIDLLPGHNNVVVAAGFSGHGFKFVPVVGNIVKDLAITGQTALPIGMFKLNRFEPVAV